MLTSIQNHHDKVNAVSIQPGDMEFTPAFPERFTSKACVKAEIPIHHGYPCLWLVVPTTKSTKDFHLRVIPHAGHTVKK